MFGLQEVLFRTDETFLSTKQVFKISSSLAVTQMSQSSSNLSQVASDMYKGTPMSNETLCNELIGVLRRALSQSASVKLKVYLGVYDVVGKNPELCNPLMDLLMEHATNQDWMEQEHFGSIVNLDRLMDEEDDKVVMQVTLNLLPEHESILLHFLHFMIIYIFRKRLVGTSTAFNN